MISKKDVHDIRDRAATKLKAAPIQLYWSYTEEVSQDDKIAIAWIEATLEKLQIGAEIDYKKDRR